MQNKSPQNKSLRVFTQNTHGHPQFDAFLEGVRAANQLNTTKIKDFQSHDCRCEVCSGWGILIQETAFYSPHKQPLCAFVSYTECNICRGAGLDQVKLKQKEKLQ